MCSDFDTLKSCNAETIKILEITVQQQRYYIRQTAAMLCTVAQASETESSEDTLLSVKTKCRIPTCVYSVLKKTVY